MMGRVPTLARKDRLAAISALMAAGCAISGSVAQSADAGEELVPAAATAAAHAAALPAFTPSAEAQFDEAFAHLEGNLATPAISDHAVDMSTIEPDVGPRMSEDMGQGVASFYGTRFAGRPTASGETFNPSEFTAAHKTLPFGSRVRVTNPRNGNSVIVRINDRGPYVRGRVIDVSRAAAEELGMVRAGHATVQLELLED